MPLIALKGVSRTYRSRAQLWSKPQALAALKNVDLEVHAGEVLAVVGPSGSGKSTLARIAAGIEAPDTGTVSFEGELLGSMTPAARFAACRFAQLAFQEAASALDPRLRIHQSIEAPLWVQGLPRAGAAVRLAKLVQLDPSVLERYPYQLSGGQKQRVGLARALALAPRVLVLDEPLAALDASAAAHILQVLDHLRQTRDLGIVWVTHDLRAVSSFATRVAVLEAGEIRQIGSPLLVFGAAQDPR